MGIDLSSKLGIIINYLNYKVGNDFDVIVYYGVVVKEYILRKIIVLVGIEFESY